MRKESSDNGTAREARDGALASLLLAITIACAIVFSNVGEDAETIRARAEVANHKLILAGNTAALSGTESALAEEHRVLDGILKTPK